MKHSIFFTLIIMPVLTSANQDVNQLSCMPEYWAQMSNSGSAGTKYSNGIEGIKNFDFKKNKISGGSIIEDELHQWSYKIKKLSDHVYQGLNALDKRVYVFSSNNTRLIQTIPDGSTSSVFFYRCN